MAVNRGADFMRRSHQRHSDSSQIIKSIVIWSSITSSHHHRYHHCQTRHQICHSIYFHPIPTTTLGEYSEDIFSRSPNSIAITLTPLRDFLSCCQVVDESRTPKSEHFVRPNIGLDMVIFVWEGVELTRNGRKVESGNIKVRKWKMLNFVG